MVEPSCEPENVKGLEERKANDKSLKERKY